MFLVDISGYVPKPKDSAIFLTRTDKKVIIPGIQRRALDVQVDDH